MSLARKVWDTLSPINVNDVKMEKNGLAYLPWSDAVDILSQHFPDNDFELSLQNFPDGSVMCYVTLTIREGEEVLKRKMWLPVMDYRNKAIYNPTSRDVSDNAMRCLAKTISVVTGLGLYIYQGEELPSAEKAANDLPATEEQLSAIRARAEELSLSEEKLCQALNISTLSLLKAQAVPDVHKRLDLRAEKMGQ